MDDSAFDSLIAYLGKVSGIEGTIGFGTATGGLWWIKFSIDIRNSLAWNVVQELGHVANYLSIDERLPTIFYPVSPPPYMNGSPEDFLSWMIESKDPEFHPNALLEWLEGRLPEPVTDHGTPTDAIQTAASTNYFNFAIPSGTEKSRHQM